MADDPNKRGAADRSRIDTGTDYEVAYWTKALGVTKEALIAAVKAVGNSTEAVRKHLKK